HGLVVYAGGNFKSIGGQRRAYLAALDARTSRATAWDPDADSGVRALAIHGNTLFAGGVFFHVGGQVRKYLAAVDLDTGDATSWDARVSRIPEDYNYDGGPRVLALQVVGNTLYVAGAFSHIGSEPRASLAAVDVRSGAATEWD